MLIGRDAAAIAGTRRNIHRRMHTAICRGVAVRDSGFARMFASMDNSEPVDRTEPDPAAYHTDLSGEAEKMLPAVYEELRRLARARLAKEPAGLTLQPTGLVHEAYLRLAGENNQWQNKAHFFAAAAIAMRRILIERARRKRVVREARSVTDLESGEDPESVDLLALDPALDKLCTFDRRLADVVQLRFFAGLTVEQTAEVMGVAPRTVKRDWNFARAWLKQEMEGAAGG